MYIGMSFLKIVRLYYVHLLHYPVELIIRKMHETSDKFYVNALVYTYATCM